MGKILVVGECCLSELTKELVEQLGHDVTTVTPESAKRLYNGRHADVLGYRDRLNTVCDQITDLREELNLDKQNEPTYPGKDDQVVNPHGSNLNKKRPTRKKRVKQHGRNKRRK